MKKMYKPLSILLCCALVMAAPANAYATEKSASDYKEELEAQQKKVDESKAEIENSESKIDALEGNMAELNSEKKELQTAKNELESVVEELDGQLTTVQMSLTEITDKIEKTEKKIEKTKKELKEAEQLEIDQYIAMKQRIKFMYEKGDTAYINMLFSATNLSDMLNKAEYIEEVSAYDRNMLNTYTENKYRITNLKRQLENNQEDLAQAQYDETVKQEQMSDLVDQKNGEIKRYEEEISDREAAIKEYESMIASQNATIAALEASILKAEREAQRLEEEYKEAGLSENDIENAESKKPAQKVYNGPFCHPAPSTTRVSDDYGNRIHPTLGVQQFHNGIDFAAPGGSPILAAQSGTVIAASYSATMGNYIMINHGGGLVTIYMHASALYVSAGQTVTKGQKIAAVGTTGRSTGNHLHFSVRLNGSYVSPWNYL